MIQAVSVATCMMGAESKECAARSNELRPRDGGSDADDRQTKEDAGSQNQIMNSVALSGLGKAVGFFHCRWLISGAFVSAGGVVENKMCGRRWDFPPWCIGIDSCIRRMSLGSSRVLTCEEHRSQHQGSYSNVKMYIQTTPLMV